MKITDEEISHQSGLVAELFDSKNEAFVEAAKWCRDRYEREKKAIPERVTVYGKLKEVLHIAVGSEEDCTWLSPKQFNEVIFGNTLAHDEKLQEGKEKSLTEDEKREIYEWMKKESEREYFEKMMTPKEAYDKAVIDSMKMDKEIADMNHKLGTAITDNSHLRETALKMSRDLNPNVVNPQLAYGQYGSTPPSIDKILTDAEKIYEWLIKE